MPNKKNVSKLDTEENDTNCIKCGRDLPEGAVFCCWCGRKQIREKKRRTRANGQGCVSKLPNGKWRAEKTLGYKLDPLPPDAPPGTKPHKRRIVVTKHFATRTEALAALPLAARLNTKRQTVGNYETGERGLDVETICALCDIFGVTADYLLCRSDTASPALSAEEEDLLLCWRSADGHTRDVVQLLLAPFRQDAAAAGSI